MNGKHEVLRTFFFDQDRQPELENIGTRREVNGKCELKITDQISSAHEKQKISLFRLFHCNSRLQKLGKTWNLFSIRFCFGNSWEKKGRSLYPVIPTTILSFLQSVIFTWIHFCSRGSPTIFIYIYTVRFNQIPCRSLRLHLSLQEKHQQTDHQ